MSRSFLAVARTFRMPCRFHLDASPSVRSAPQPQYPIADKLADKIIAKYQTSSCAQLTAQKQAPANAQHEEMETKVIDLLKQNPPMRQHFLNRIAGPIVNKMFECGMIP